MAVATMHPALAVPELLDQILDVSVHDRSTLKRCALVNKTWCETVRPALFARIAVVTDVHLHELLSALATHHWLGAHVRTLTVGPGSCLSRRALGACDLRPLRTLTALRELVWIGVDWTPLFANPERRAVLRAAFAHVGVLHLERILKSSRALIDFVAAFPALRELHLGALMTYESPSPSPLILDQWPPSHTAKLERFEVVGHAQLEAPFWEGVLDSLDFSNLREMKTDCYMPATIFGLLKICGRATESLRTLTLVADFTHPSEYDRKEHGLLVAAATNLVTLRVAANIDIAGAAAWLAYTVASIKSDALRTIEFDLSFTSTRRRPVESENWDAVSSAIRGLSSGSTKSSPIVEVKVANAQVRRHAELAMSTLILGGVVLMSE